MTKYFVTLYFLVAFAVTAHESNLIKDPDNIVIKIEPLMIDSVRVTYYEPVKAQCAGNPLITATNARINPEKLRKGEIRWVAISRDLEEVFSMGDSIDIFIAENHPWNGRYLINDRTSKRLKKTVDILSNTFKGGCYNNAKITEI